MNKINPEKPNTKEWLNVIRKGIEEEPKSKLWRKLYKETATTSRTRNEVNIFKINKCSANEDRVIVPGKILGEGKMDHPVTITAMEFTKKGLQELQKANCKIININELYADMKSSKKVKIITK
ncbi:50S ribosomal protein L18e [Candidatus Marsarchaeota archaeon]|jgi:large subunit ribosomal protein L18e|nr:50S ribosomal protein L18e [Candidatus Marsarchaeota archaeon]MCL5089922.1 50S ribosomal protein L18e [Candidatus Marsarchaeota archaeon]